MHESPHRQSQDDVGVTHKYTPRKKKHQHTCIHVKPLTDFANGKYMYDIVRDMLLHGHMGYGTNVLMTICSNCCIRHKLSMPNSFPSVVIY